MELDFSRQDQGALRRPHYGSGPSRGGPEEIIAVSLLLTVYKHVPQGAYKTSIKPLISRVSKCAYFAGCQHRPIRPTLSGPTCL